MNPSPNPSRLFLASRIALVVTAVSFALRANANPIWARQFHLTYEQIGWIDGTAFWGFTLAMIFGGPLCDALGLGWILAFAFVGHLAGIILTATAWNFASLYLGTLLFGIANGSVEAACNPLVATLYSHDKTTYLNRFHVWFPGGIAVGGLWGYAADHLNLGWRTQFAAMLIPLIAYGAMFIGQKFPATERVQSGVSTRAMFKACLRPAFLLMVVCMFMTAATELGTTQWIPTVLAPALPAAGLGTLVLVWINILMAASHQCAGPFVHKLSPLGMLIGSAILSGLGLIALSHSHGWMLFAAAVIFAFGVCFFWPTMLGYVNEQFPDTGAVGLAIMGGAGMLSAGQVLPIFGRMYDRAITAGVPAGQTASGLAAAPLTSELGRLWTDIQANAGLQTIGRMVVLPVALTVIFALILAFRRRKA